MERLFAVEGAETCEVPDAGNRYELFLFLQYHKYRYSISISSAFISSQVGWSTDVWDGSSQIATDEPLDRRLETSLSLAETTRAARFRLERHLLCIH